MKKGRRAPASGALESAKCDELDLLPVLQAVLRACAWGTEVSSLSAATKERVEQEERTGADAPSRPKPDSFTPPKGTPACEMRPVLTPTCRRRRMSAGGEARE